MEEFHLHLVSDATGETVQTVARACLVQFEGAQPTQHIWTLVRNVWQIEEVKYNFSRWNAGEVIKSAERLASSPSVSHFCPYLSQASEA